MDSLITKISVRNLFGMYSYDLPNPKDTPGDTSSLLILYGENGSGKSTILRILYWAISPARGKGYKSSIARTSFDKFIIDFKTNYRIVLERPDGELVGGFTQSIFKGSTLIASYTFTVDTKGSFIETSDPKYNLFIEQLKLLDVSIHYMSDNRVVLSDSNGDENSYDQNFRRRKDMSPEALKWSSLPHLDIAVEGAFNWARTQAMRSARTVYASSDEVYSNLVQSLVNVDSKSSILNSKSLLLELEELQKANNDFSAMGLTPPLKADKFKYALNSSKEENPTINQIIKTYIDGVKARLEGLDSLKSVMSKFVDNLNSFYHDKHFDFDIRNGLSLYTKDGKNLELNHLSSGEKQLLLLLCNVLSQRDVSNIFIIDEPEISLNIKWQRNLIRALLDCIESSHSQFIIATHSFELLAPNKFNVASLNNLNS